MTPPFDPALYVVVPREPTGEMWSAGRRAFDEYATKFKDATTSEAAMQHLSNGALEVFAAMLAAAPPASTEVDREAQERLMADADPLAIATFKQLGLRHWDAFYLGWCEMARAIADAAHPQPADDAPKSARELELEDVLTSARCIAQRKGENTAWERFDARIAKFGIGSVTAKVFKVLPSDPQPPVADDARHARVLLKLLGGKRPEGLDEAFDWLRRLAGGQDAPNKEGT